MLNCCCAEASPMSGAVSGNDLRGVKNGRRSLRICTYIIYLTCNIVLYIFRDVRKCYRVSNLNHVKKYTIIC